MRGIDPRTSRMLNERSTIWATSPLRKRRGTTLSNLSFVIEIVEQSPLVPIVVILALDAGHQSMCFSHATRLPSRLTCLAGGVQRSYLCYTDVFDWLNSLVMIPPTSFLGKPWWFGTPIAFSASSVLFQVLPFPYWTYKSMSSFGLTKQLTVFPFLISGLLWKIGDAGHRSPYLSHAKRALYHLSYIPVEEAGS